LIDIVASEKRIMMLTVGIDAGTEIEAMFLFRVSQDRRQELQYISRWPAESLHTPLLLRRSCFENGSAVKRGWMIHCLSS
jgi:hypothetical protein